MTVSDSFTFAVNGDLCEVITHSRLTGSKLKRFLGFTFDVYAPIVVVSESMHNIDYAYTFAQAGSTVDLDKLLRILSKQEMGWNLTDEVLFSPRPSGIRPNDLMRAISAARLSDCKANL